MMSMMLTLRATQMPCKTSQLLAVLSKVARRFKYQAHSTALPIKSYEIELYSNQTCNADVSGTASAEQHGEGENFIATAYVMTNASGNGTFNVTLPAASVVGDYISSLAANVTPGDDEEGNTSEFSACATLGSCTALSNEVNEAILAPSKVAANDKIFVATSSIGNNAKQGHLRAYTVQSDGSTTLSSPAWDTATGMTASERDNRLYSTNNLGDIVTLTTMDTAAFGSMALPTKATIVSYTVTPTYDSGIYLGGRVMALSWEPFLQRVISPKSPIRLMFGLISMTRPTTVSTVIPYSLAQNAC